MSFQEDFDRDSRPFPQNKVPGKFREFGSTRGRSAYRGPRPPRFPDTWRRESGGAGTYRDGKDKWGWDKDRSPAVNESRTSTTGKDRYERYSRDNDREERNRGRYPFAGERDSQKKSLIQSMQVDRRPTLLGSRYHSTRESDPRFDEERDSSSSPIDVVGDSPPGKGGFDDLDNVDDISGDEDDYGSSKRPRLSLYDNQDLYPERSSRLLMSVKAESLSPLSPGEVTPPRYDRPQLLHRSRLLPQMMHTSSSDKLQQAEELEPLEDKFDAISDDEVEAKKEDGTAAANAEETKDDDPRKRLPAREEIFSALEKIDSEINKMVKRLERVQAKKRATEGDVQEEEDLSQMDDATRIAKENNMKAMSVYKAVTKILGDYTPKDPYKPLFRRPSEVPGFLENQQRHKLSRPLLIQKFSAKNIRLMEKKKELVSIYKAHAEKWKIKAKRFERKKEKLVKMPALPEPRAQLQPSQSDRKPSGRSRNRHGDAVRSEEEMQQILMELLEEERENPEIGYIRTLAVIPPMILDEDEKDRKFINHNGLVENAEELEREVKFGSPWTEQEKAIFVESYLAYPKNFRKIRTFLQNKTTEDVIQFYYLNKRSLGLKQRLKQGNKRRRAQQKGGSAKSQMLISQAQQPRRREPKEEVALPPAAAPSAPVPAPSQAVTDDSTGDQPTRWAESEKEKAIEAFTLYGLDFNQVAAHVGSKTSLQCRNFFNNNKKKYNLEKIVEERPKRPSLSTDQGEQPQKMDSDGEDNKDVSHPDSPDEDEKPPQKGEVAPAKKKPRQQQKERRPIAVWTNAEKNQIVKLLGQFGKNWNKLSQEVKTKTPDQIKNFFQNYKQKLNLGKVLPRTGRRKTADQKGDGDDDDEDEDKEKDLEPGEQVDMKEFESAKVKKEPKSGSKSATQSQATTPLPSPKNLPQPQILLPLNVLTNALPQQPLSMASNFVSPLFSLAEISSSQAPLPGLKTEEPILSLPQIPTLPSFMIPESTPNTSPPSMSVSALVPMEVTPTETKKEPSEQPSMA